MKTYYTLEYSWTNKIWNIFKNIEIIGNGYGGTNYKTIYSGSKKECKNYIKEKGIKIGE